MGGAPPPPLDFAAQGVRKSQIFGPPSIKVLAGAGGAPTNTQRPGAGARVGDLREGQSGRERRSPRRPTSPGGLAPDRLTPAVRGALPPSLPTLADRYACGVRVVPRLGGMGPLQALAHPRSPPPGLVGYVASRA